MHLERSKEETGSLKNVAKILKRYREKIEEFWIRVIGEQNEKRVNEMVVKE